MQTATDKLYCTQGGRPILGRRVSALAEKFFVVRNKQVERWLIFIDLGEASDWLFEDVVRQIIIDRRYFADQDVLFLGDEAMPNAGQERDTFARRKSQFPTGGQTPRLGRPSVSTTTSASRSIPPFLLDMNSSSTSFPPPRLMISSVLILWRCIGLN